MLNNINVEAILGHIVKNSSYSSNNRNKIKKD